MTLTAWLGAEYGLEVWLNGRRLFSDDQLGDGLQPQPDQAMVKLPLAAGTNLLVLRLLDVRRSGFYFSTVGRNRIAPDPIENLLEGLEEDFSIPTRRMLGDVSKHEVIAWFRGADEVDLIGQLTGQAARQLGSHNQELQAKLLGRRGTEASADARHLLAWYARASRLRKAWSDLELVDFAAMRRAIRDLTDTFSERYPQGEEYLRRVNEFERQLPRIQAGLERESEAAVEQVADLVAFQRKALLANPLLDFDRLLLIQRETLGDPRRPGRACHAATASPWR